MLLSQICERREVMGTGAPVFYADFLSKGRRAWFLFPWSWQGQHGGLRGSSGQPPAQEHNPRWLLESPPQVPGSGECQGVDRQAPAAGRHKTEIQSSESFLL